MKNDYKSGAENKVWGNSSSEAETRRAFRWGLAVEVERRDEGNSQAKRADKKKLDKHMT